mmetsp:Transcript_101478/g.175322  ORF Transcript_101478/g.175322 Transcript_101478/m.175322 type:complete len:240 (+) Transcript_101478:733-1452(+)
MCWLHHASKTAPFYNNDMCLVRCHRNNNNTNVLRYDCKNNNNYVSRCHCPNTIINNNRHAEVTSCQVQHTKQEQIAPGGDSASCIMYPPLSTQMLRNKVIVLLICYNMMIRDTPSPVSIKLRHKGQRALFFCICTHSPRHSLHIGRCPHWSSRRPSSAVQVSRQTMHSLFSITRTSDLSTVGSCSIQCDVACGCTAIGVVCCCGCPRAELRCSRTELSSLPARNQACHSARITAIETRM